MSESAPEGEADRSSNADSKEVSRHGCPNCCKSYSEKSDLTIHMRGCCPGGLYECPTCGNGYISEMGVKMHHSRTHGESIAYNERECDYCGDVIEVPDHILNEQEHHFCDRKCSAAWQEERVEIECSVCGDSFEVIKFREETASYCSRKCRIEGTRRITGNERYNYKTETYECQECGESVERSPSMVYSPDRVFCSDACFDEHRRNGYDDYYGSNWYQQRRKALKRDQYRCQVCGVTAAELQRDPDVHHLTPITWYKNNYDEPEWWERANQLTNLVTYCRSCHGEWEGIPLRPQ